MIGLAFTFSSASFVASQKAALNRSVDKALAADMLITSSELLHSRSFHFSENTAMKVGSLPEAARADLARVTATEIDGLEVTLLAHDMAAYFDVSPDLLDSGNPGRAKQLTARGEGVLISNNLGLRWHLGLGDILTIHSPKGDLRLPIVGMLDYYRSENGTIWIERELYKKYWDDTDVDYIILDLKPGVDRESFKQKIQAVIAGSQRAFIYTHEEYKAWVDKLIDQFFTTMYVQMVIAIIVAAIGLINTILISVAERRRELGTFRAVGGLRKQVVKMVILESAAISLIGFVTGVLAGMMNAYFLINTAAKIVAEFDLPFRFPYAVIGFAIPMVIATAIVAAWLPARHAARMQIAESIGYE
jgi:putative ABC transport system permease protein